MIYYGDLECDALYYGDILLWQRQTVIGTEDGLWHDDETWNDDDTWLELA